MEPDAAAIRRDLDRLAVADPGGRLFGSDTHGHRLNPPVAAATLARAELALGCPLPAEYRWFLTSVGDGGPGPYYGILPLAEALDRMAQWRGDLDPLAGDCPLTADVCFGELAGAPDDWDEHVARLESDPAYEARYEELTDSYLDRPWIDGRLPIADYGCGDWFFLVARGPRRGTVWVDSVCGATGLYCLEVHFLTFYRRWLDDALDRVERRAFGPRNAQYSYLEYGDNPRYRPM